MSDTTRRLKAIDHAAPQSSDSPQAPPADRISLPIPNIVEFAHDPRYLGRALYPNQALLLKLMTCSVELLTNHDRTMLEQWESGFALKADRDGYHYVGDIGLAPGTEQRMQACLDRGRVGFREITLVIGRRGGKGFLTAIMAAHALWRLLSLHDPNAHFGIDRAKPIVVMCFAADKPQAVANLFNDIAGMLTTSECFDPFMEYAGSDEVRLRSPIQLERMAQTGQSEKGLIVIKARPTTAGAGRGPTAMGLIIDEAAHLPAEGLQRSADLLYAGAKPALAQFGSDSFTVLASSPSDQTGAFYAAHRRALEADENGVPIDPTAFTVVLTTFDPYHGWEATNPDLLPEGVEPLRMWPDGPSFPVFEKALLSYDQDMRDQERDDPDNFRVEHLAQWRTSPSAYLSADLVRSIFDDWRGQELKMEYSREHRGRYAIHVDPSKTNANLAIAVAHLERQDDGADHVVYDLLEHIDPHDSDDGKIHYKSVVARLKVLVLAFVPEFVTFDQFESGMMIEEVRTWVTQQQGLWIRAQVFERTATKTSNFATAETFKMLALAGRLHAPYYEQAHKELAALQERNGRVTNPTTGPVRTSDVADAMMNVAAQLLEPGSATAELMNIPLRATDFRPRNDHDAEVLRGMSGFTRANRDALHAQNPARLNYRQRSRSRRRW